MSRQKKSRKGPSLNAGKMRLSKEKLAEQRALKDHRPKKKKGLKAGSRNSAEELNSTKTNATPQGKKPAGMGSKKPISLVPEQKPKVVEPVLKRDLKPKAELFKAEKVTLTPEQELEQLENDQKLLALVDRHESGELLTGKDAKYFNAKVARHQELCELLGLDDEENEAVEEDFLDQYMSGDLASEWHDDEDDS